MKRVLTTLLIGLLSTMALANDESWRTYFTPEELAIMQQFESLREQYTQIGFKIKQIITKTRALVSVGDFDYIYVGDLSGNAHGDTCISFVRQGEPESFTTAIGGTRTLHTKVQISQEEMDIVTQAIALLERKEQVQAELVRKKGAASYQINREKMVAFENATQDFLRLSEQSNNSDVINLREQIINFLNSYKEAHTKKEFYGSDLPDNDLESIRKQVELMGLIVDREKRELQAKKEAEARQEAERKKLAAESRERERLRIEAERRKDAEQVRTWEKAVVLFKRVTEAIEQSVRDKPANRYKQKLYDWDLKPELQKLGGEDFAKDFLAVRKGFESLTWHQENGLVPNILTNLREIPKEAAGCSLKNIVSVLHEIKSRAPELLEAPALRRETNDTKDETLSAPEKPELQETPTPEKPKKRSWKIPVKLNFEFSN